MTKTRKITLSILLTLLAIILLIALAIYLMIVFKSEDKKFITANFVDLEQIDTITKYRSCYGHNAGRILDKESAPSSWKHYVNATDEYIGEDAKVEVYAPFDGRVLGVSSNTEGRDKHVFLFPSYSPWMVSFDHIIPLPKIKFGHKMTAGELIGYASFNPDHPETPLGFDAELVYLPQLDFGGDSHFNHMTGEVLAKFAAYGVTPENIIISNEYREANPCECYEGGNSNCRFLPQNVYPDHAIKLERRE